jgi:RHS repeat-associated protein
MPSPLVPRTIKTTVSRGFGYYPFGMMQEGRQFVGGMGYRWGFNGKPLDQETLTMDYGLRIYSPRLSKFLSTDPLAPCFPWNSTYAFAENDVIRCIDLEGMEKYVVVHCWEPSSDGKQRYTKYNGTVLIYLPNVDYNRLYRDPANKYTDMTMTIHKEMTREQMNAISGRIYDKNPETGKYDILKNHVRCSIFDCLDPSSSQKSRLPNAVFTPSSNKMSEIIRLNNVESNFNDGIFARINLLPAPTSLFYNFDKINSTELTPEYIASLQTFLTSNPDYVINVTGFTDKVGSDEYNMQLGLNRANDVKTRLVKLGINKDRIQTFSRGELDSTVPESADVDVRQKDRRVEVQWAPRAPQQ